MIDTVNEGNGVVAVDDLPVTSDPSFEQLDRVYVKMVMLTWILVVLTIVLINVGATALSDEGFEPIIDSGATPFVLAGLFFLSVAAFVVPRVLWHSKGYQLHSHNLHYKDGVFWRAVTSLPFARVQHVELESGPLERIFKLATLKFYTAGGGSADIKIPGLPFASASKIRTYVLERSGAKMSGTDPEKESDE